MWQISFPSGWGRQRVIANNQIMNNYPDFPSFSSCLSIKPLHPSPASSCTTQMWFYLTDATKKIQCRMSLLVNRHFLLKSFVENNWIFLLFTIPFFTSSEFFCLSFLGPCCFWLLITSSSSPLSLSFSAFISGHFPPFSIPWSPKDVSHYLRTAQFPTYPLI